MKLLFRLCAISTRTDLAHKLRVDVKALDLVLVSSPSESCASDGCNLPSIKYDQRHRVRGEGRNWEIRKMSRYRDGDGKNFEFPPPNGKIQNFIDTEIPSPAYARGGYDDALPSWLKGMARQQGDVFESPDVEMADTITPRKFKGGIMAATATPTPRPGRKRGTPESFEVDELKDKVRMLQAQLTSALDEITLGYG